MLERRKMATCKSPKSAMEGKILGQEAVKLDFHGIKS